MPQRKRLTILISLAALTALTGLPYGGESARAAVPDCTWKDGPIHMDGALEFPDTNLGGLGQIWKPERDSSDVTTEPKRYDRHHRRRESQSHKVDREHRQREHARQHNPPSLDD